MVDLTNPSPLVMTHYELFAFSLALAGVAVAVARDFFARYRRRHDR